MKKTYSLLLSAVLCAAMLSGCAQNAAPAPSAAGTAAAAPETTKAPEATAAPETTAAPGTENAAETTAATAAAAPEEGIFVLMNIPYDEFYAAEGVIDSISSATLKGKARNVNVNGASYHQSEEAVSTEGIAGATFPVKASAADLEALGGTEVTDDSLIAYTMNVRGTDTEMKLEGAGALQESPSYSYYVLQDAPASYKELSLADGAASFGPAAGQAASGSASGEVSYTGHHTDIEIALEGVEIDASQVSGMIITMEDGSAYAMHHVVNIWRNEVGWDLSDLDLGGQTITGLRYLMKDGSILDYSVEIPILPAYEGSFSGSVNEDETAYRLEGSLEGLEDAVLTVTCTVGSGRGVPSGVVYEGEAAELVELDSAKIEELKAQGEAGAEVNFSAVLSSSNYAAMIVGADS